MIKILKRIYFFIKLRYLRFKFYLTVNWLKTLYFNFKMLPFYQAKKLPIFFYGSVKFSNLKGEVSIENPVSRGMIGFGQAYELASRSSRTAELVLKGRIIFRGYVQFGKDYFVFVGENAVLDLGNMSSLASKGKIICANKIMLKDYARLGSECQIIDTDFHQMINLNTGEKYEKTKPIVIGEFNYIGRRTSIMKGTSTAEHCTIASNTLCNKDYTHLGTNVLIGGIPAKLLKENISRDWEGEMERMERHLISKYIF